MRLKTGHTLNIINNSLVLPSFKFVSKYLSLSCNNSIEKYFLRKLISKQHYRCHIFIVMFKLSLLSHVKSKAIISQSFVSPVSSIKNGFVFSQTRTFKH